MAVLAAPMEARLVLLRVELGYMARHRLSTGVKELIADQVGVAARGAPRALAAMARRRYALRWVRDALQSDSVALRRFESAYLAARR